MTTDKLCLIVFETKSQLWQTTVYKTVHRDQEEFLSLCFTADEFSKEYPCFSFEPVKCAGSIYTGVYKDVAYVAVDSKASGKTLGVLEMTIFYLTGKRGLGHHINQLEILSPPGSQLHKFIEKRF